MSEVVYDVEFDYVIVGVGFVGVVFVYWFSESGEYLVCVLEFGGSDNFIFIKMFIVFFIFMNMKCYDWGFYFEKEFGFKGCSLY